MEKEKKTQYISLKQASLISGYHPDYLSYLIRKGKVKGVRVGKSWLTTRESVLHYLSETKREKKKVMRKKIVFKNSKETIKKIFVVSSFSIILILIGFLLGQHQKTAFFSSEDILSRKDYSQKISTQSTSTDQEGKIVINVYSQNPLDAASQLRSTINSFLQNSNDSGLMISNSIKNLKY